MLEVISDWKAMNKISKANTLYWVVVYWIETKWTMQILCSSKFITIA